MDRPGRPTLYKPELAEQAYELCLMGATSQDLADCFEVAASTIDNWLQKIPDFADAVRRGRAFADGKVARGLYARAVGYDHQATRILLHRGEPVTVQHTVHRPPDIRACIFWLRNRRPRQWRAGDAPPQDDRLADIRALDEASEQARQEARCALHDPGADAPG